MERGRGHDPNLGRDRRMPGATRQKRAGVTGIFRDAKDVLDGLAWAEKYRDGSRRKCDWDNRDEVNLYCQELRRKRREQRLENMVPSRVCWRCRLFKPHSADWVHITDIRERHLLRILRARRSGSVEKLPSLTAAAEVTLETAKSLNPDYSRPFVCQTCWKAERRRIKEGRPPMEINIDELAKEIVIRRFAVNGIALAASRTALGMTAAQFARKAGWSRSYQTRIENELADIPEGTWDTIKQVLQEAIAQSATTR